jgi:Autotransporter beta-domain
VLSGAGPFALAYGAKSVAVRGEFGIRTDKSYAVSNGILTLRGHFAWAHDFDPDRSIAATFQALPGASFVVNGAAQAHEAALTTASAEMKWLNDWSAAPPSRANSPTSPAVTPLRACCAIVGDRRFALKILASRTTLNNNAYDLHSRRAKRSGAFVGILRLTG